MSLIFQILDKNKNDSTKSPLKGILACWYHKFVQIPTYISQDHPKLRCHPNLKRVLRRY